MTFPQPAIPHVEYISDLNKQERMCIQHQYEACNLARIHCTSASSSFTNITRSETDFVGMASLERSKTDSSHSAHAHYFLGKMRQGGNPQYAAAPAHLRLGGQVNWTSDDRSNENQTLNPGFAMEWSLAMLKDWISMNPVLRVGPQPSWTDMVMTRGRQPNIIMGTKEFDTKLSESRNLEGSASAPNLGSTRTHSLAARTQWTPTRLTAGRRRTQSRPR